MSQGRHIYAIAGPSRSTRPLGVAFVHTKVAFVDMDKASKIRQKELLPTKQYHNGDCCSTTKPRFTDKALATVLIDETIDLSVIGNVHCRSNKEEDYCISCMEFWQLLSQEVSS